MQVWKGENLIWTAFNIHNGLFGNIDIDFACIGILWGVNEGLLYYI